MTGMSLAHAVGPLAHVMILGTYHFANPGLDAVKSQIRDTMSPGRQHEIQELVTRLEKFHPTKIAIEATPDRANEINDRLANYLKGSYKLTPNEVDQVGLRLAKQCGIAQLSPIDNQMDLDFDRLFSFLGVHDKDRAQHLRGLIQSLGNRFEAWDKAYSVSQIMAIHNNPVYIAESHRFYVSMCDATDGKLYPGADMLGEWYKRNARIYGNLRRSVQKGDRLLVIFGSGHSKPLRELVQDSGELELVDSAQYLPACPVQPGAMVFSTRTAGTSG